MNRIAFLDGYTSKEAGMAQPPKQNFAKLDKELDTLTSKPNTAKGYYNKWKLARGKDDHIKYHMAKGKSSDEAVRRAYKYDDLEKQKQKVKQDQINREKNSWIDIKQ